MEGGGATLFQANANGDTGYLTAVYDLDVNSVTFDFVENYQVLSLEPDTFENISKEFYKFLAVHP